MLAARALEDMSAHVLALIDDKLNPLSEDEIAIQNAAKSKRKAKGYERNEEGEGRERKGGRRDMGSSGVFIFFCFF